MQKETDRLLETNKGEDDTDIASLFDGNEDDFVNQLGAATAGSDDAAFVIDLGNDDFPEGAALENIASNINNNNAPAVSLMDLTGPATLPASGSVLPSVPRSSTGPASPTTSARAVFSGPSAPPRATAGPAASPTSSGAVSARSAPRATTGPAPGPGGPPSSSSASASAGHSPTSPAGVGSIVSRSSASASVPGVPRMSMPGRRSRSSGTGSPVTVSPRIPSNPARFQTLEFPPDGEAENYEKVKSLVLNGFVECFVWSWLRVILVLLGLPFLLCSETRVARLVRERLAYLLFFLLSFLYGFYAAFSLCRFDTGCLINSSNLLDVYFFVAKTTIRISAIFQFCAVVLVIRSITSRIDSVPRDRRKGLDWRSLHMQFMLNSYFWALCHMVAHLVRYTHGYAQLEGYEIFFLVSGSLLALCLVIQLLTLLTRSMFRKWHWVFTYVNLVIYFLHSRYFSPIVLLLMYSLDYFMHKQTFDHVRVCRSVTSSEIVLCFTFNNGDSAPNIPNTPGYYYQICVNGYQASYTFVAVNGTAVFHVLKKSTIANLLFPLARDGLRNLDGSRTVVEKDVISLYGPFESNDYLSRQVFHKCYITSGAGQTVQYDSIEYRSRVGGGACKVVYFHVRGRSLTSAQRNALLNSSFGPNEGRIHELNRWVQTHDTISVEHCGKFGKTELVAILNSLSVGYRFHFILCGGAVVKAYNEMMEYNAMPGTVTHDKIHFESFGENFTWTDSEASRQWDTLLV